MVTDLERTGDKARKIARLSAAIRESDVADRAWQDDVLRLSDHARALLRRTLDAFVRAELPEAIAVIRDTKAIGRQVNAVANDIIRRMSENPAQVAVLLDMLAVTRSIDRVADYAGNIAEHLIYIVRGTDVRHATLDQIEKETLAR
jgi:phosphate transport system protein